MERIVSFDLTGHGRMFMTGEDEVDICHKVRERIKKELDEGGIYKVFQDDFTIYIGSVQPIRQEKTT